MPENQPVIRPGRTCVDRTSTLRQISESRQVFRRPMISVFLGLKDVFDSVDHVTLWYAGKVHFTHPVSLCTQPKLSSRLRRPFTRVHQKNWFSLGVPTFHLSFSTPSLGWLRR